MTYTDSLNRIDWKLLREQKQSLLDVIYQVEPENSDNPDPQQKQWVEHLIGIMHLLDDLQDAAVNSKLVSEDKVFGELGAPA